MAALITKFNIEPVQLKEKDLINLGVCWSVYISLLLEDFYSHFLITGRFYSQDWEISLNGHQIRCVVTKIAIDILTREAGDCRPCKG